MNEYFVPGAVPAPNSPGASATIRAEFSSVAIAFDKLPVLAGSANEFVIVNSTGTAMIASGYLFSDFVTLNAVQTLTNKTIAWSDNVWPGFASGATKVAGTDADNVLLLAENAKLPALDGSQLTNLTPASLGVVPVLNGGTGATDVAGAQVNLGINLKADANNAVLTGAPTCPTPPVGNSSARLANTQFVTDTVTSIGAAVPSDATPLINGVAASGISPLVSRDDHVHPVDTSRAPAAAATATGTSFTPVGGIAATNVQTALSELDTEKAPLASPALTGTPTSTTPLTSDNSTRIATTAFMQSLLAQQPPGVEVSDSNPLMNGVVAPGTGVEASRYDHVHPSDTSRAPLASPSFTGTPTAPTATAGTNNTQLATTAFATAAAAAVAIPLPVTVLNGGTGSTTAAGARTNLGLGSAATLTAGTAANNAVQLTAAAKLPAVDASLLTGVVVPDNSVAPAKLTQPFTAGTAVSASGTAVDFTGVPSWAKRVTVLIAGLSGSGTSVFMLRAGTSGGVVTSGYTGGAALISTSDNTTRATAYTTGFGLHALAPAAANFYSGTLVLTKISGNQWVCSGGLCADAGAFGSTNGTISLGAALDRVRITTVNGTDTFDAGSINVMWE